MDLMHRDSPARIRLPYGDADVWLITGFDSVKQVITDHRLSRGAIIGHDYPGWLRT
ncbi:hypothetical protein [Streptomyces sp. NPDC096311]|uniref:hypothetical protein n=1 Tax=Streptomyces sp. NPDC096311 TaxID=3366083 RepID=UPI003814868F